MVKVGENLDERLGDTASSISSSEAARGNRAIGFLAKAVCQFFGFAMYVKSGQMGPTSTEFYRGLLTSAVDTSRNSMEYTRRGIDNLSPSGIIRNALAGISSIIEQERRVYSYEIDLLQIEDGALSERAWEILNVISLTMPTCRGVDATRNPSDEIQRLNMRFERMENPRPAILASDFLVYVAGQQAAQLNHSNATAVMLNGHHNPNLREELEFIGYRIIDKPK